MDPYLVLFVKVAYLASLHAPKTPLVVQYKINLLNRFVSFCIGFQIPCFEVLKVSLMQILPRFIWR